MYLEKIEISGFKSFAKKTTLDFASGISAIVGPNGSGKSNIADAIRWVLGEQSMKTLRGKKSDDVIFAGTDAAGRLGVAEVSLHLNNQDKSFPVDFEKAVVTRRIFRDGEGEYLINKSKVRLLDVHQLLAQAGFGQKTYGVIGQGMIDNLIKATPAELKEIFYDACGVRALQIKKTISQNKLGATKQNLERGGDLIKEIEPRLKTLKRQAKKAEQKKELTSEKEEIFFMYYGHVFNTVMAGESALDSKIDSARKNENEMARTIQDIDKKIDAGEKTHDTSKRDALVVEIESIKRKRDESNQKLYVIKGKIELEKERRTDSNVVRLKEEQEKTKSLIKEAQGEYKKSEKETARLDGELSKIIGEQEKITMLIQKTKNTIQETEKKIQEAETGVSFEDVEKELTTLVANSTKISEALGSTKDVHLIKKNITLFNTSLRKLLKSVKNRHGDAKLESFLRELHSVATKQYEDRNKKMSRINEVKVAHAVSKNKRDTIKREIDRYGRELQTLLDTIQKKEEEAKEDSGETKELLETQEKLEKEIAGITGEIETHGKHLVVLSKDDEERRKAFMLLEKHYRECQRTLNACKDDIRSLEIQKAALEQKRKQLLYEIGEDKGYDYIDEFRKKCEKNAPSLSKEKEKEYGKRLETINHRLQGIGVIDEEMVHEYLETKKRYDFLTKQSSDLTEAKSKLLAVIDELNNKIDQRFNSGFNTIGKHFQEYFKTLFGGGKAQLKKVIVHRGENDDSSDILSGNHETKRDVVIEVKANPPGKKLRDLSMLSGGERALASIALLLAIIENNPPPFIVLDEVDAALDEANSHRFAQIIQEASSKSQVLAITHNRATMNMSELLYGVTMEESGISKILSVKLEEAEHLRKKAEKPVRVS
ncbi:AAA family ATPase [Patescibacteria group bacterium]|nr:AAA family ATPase [Patescibacteria group bacterium]